HLAPVALERFQDQLDPGRMAHELVGPEPDGMLLESLVADLLDILPRHDPAGAGQDRAVVRHEVGERLAQVEAQPRRPDDLDVAHAVLEDLAGLRALEAELDRKSTRLNSSHVSISYAVF